jgi:hypothetical protein
MQHDGITATALMVLAAFAVERITTGILFILSLFRKWSVFLSGPTPAVAEKRQKLAYFVLAGTLVLIVVCLRSELRVLTVLNIDSPDPYLDIALTWLVMVAGSDRIGTLVKGAPASAPEKVSKPVEIKGTVRLIGDVKDAA